MNNYEQVIDELKNDIQYFSKMEFNELAKKFSRDLSLLEELYNKLRSMNKETT